MKLYYMKQKSLDSLQKDLVDNLEKYQNDSVWIDEYFIDKENPKYFFDTGIEVCDYELVVGGPETDFENAKIIYETYKNKINPVQASDLRLWAYLSHAQHWDYMSKRWNIDVPDEGDEPDDTKKSPREKVIDRVKTRYFFGASRGKAFVRQGIARLYWSAYLTYDENNSDPYEYTKLFFSKQDIFTSITERSYARNKILVLAALKELKKYPELSREDIRLFLAKLNQAGAITVLDFLDSQMAGELCEKLMNEVHAVSRIKEGCTFKAYNNITGKAYDHTFKIMNGKATIPGRIIPVNVTPKKLIGKKSGAKITITGQEYVIRDIEEN